MFKNSILNVDIHFDPVDVIFEHNLDNIKTYS